MAEVATAGLVEPAVLPQSRLAVRPALERVVGGLHPDLAVVARYHCGWTDRLGQTPLHSGGKTLRPALVFLAARTANPAVHTGTSPATVSDAVLAGAVAVQLVHEFSLLHDDIMDGDRVRRGRAAAWTVFGIDRALLCGDALLTLAMAQLTSRPDCAKVLAEALLRLCSGQADDLALVTRPGANIADWERMAGGKTASLLAASCQLGALLAHADPDVATTLGEVGTDLGLAFQAIDDWLDIWGDPAATGKRVGADLSARKHSLPIAITLNTPETGTDLRDMLTPDHDRTGDVAAITELLTRADAEARTHRYAHDHLARAFEHLSTLPITFDTHAQWMSLIDYLTHRIT